MPRTPEVCSCVLTLFSQFSNGCCGHLNVLPLRRLNAAFSRRIFFRHTQHHHFLHPALTAACLLILLITYHASLIPTYGQSATATLSGTIIDQYNAMVPNVSVAVINIAQGFQRSSTTDDEGVFVVPRLRPANYIVKAERDGFSPAEVRDVVLNVNDQRHLKIPLRVGGVDQTVDIVDTSPLINESPAAGTVVDRQFVENLPLNGRSFQSLIILTPGVVLTKTNFDAQRQFSVNGQRHNANYFSIDGASANIGIATGSGLNQTDRGSIPGFSVAGGANNLVSVDALQEFKAQPTPQSSAVCLEHKCQSSPAPVRISFTVRCSNTFAMTHWMPTTGLPMPIAPGKPSLKRISLAGFGGPVLLPRFGEGGRQPHYDRGNITFIFFSYEGRGAFFI